MVPAESHPIRAWHNRLPEWIPQDPPFSSLGAGPRRTLQEVANACDSPNHDGHLIGCYSGRTLLAAIGCSRATFKRHSHTLQRLGYEVQLGQVMLAGTVYRTTVNVYGIPGHRGGLEPGGGSGWTRPPIKMSRGGLILSRGVGQNEPQPSHVHAHVDPQWNPMPMGVGFQDGGAGNSGTSRSTTWPAPRD